MRAASATARQSLSETQTARDRELIRNFILGRWDFGATDEEIQDALGMGGNTERPRRGELAELKQIQESKISRKTKSGRPAAVWVSVEYQFWKEMPATVALESSAAKTSTAKQEEQPKGAKAMSTMKLLVRSFRGIDRADITANPIALVAGKNFQGKSSICQAVAAALTGQTIPFIEPGAVQGEFKPRIAKKSAGALVRTGTAKGGVLVKRGDGEDYAGINWPACEMETKGKAPRASVYAAGLIPIMELDAKRRSAFFSDLIGAHPVKEDLVNFLTDLDMGKPERIDQIWAMIEQNGWDATHTQAKEHGARLKGQWQGITNEAYGSNKAQGWLPAEWETDLETASLDALQAALAGHKAALEAVVGDQAVDKAELDRLQAIAAEQLPDQQPYIDAEQAAGKALADAKAALDALPIMQGDSGPPALTCAHCGETNLLTGRPGTFALMKPGKKPSKAAIEKAQKARAAAQAKVDEAGELHEAAKADLRAVLDQYDFRDDAKKGLEAAKMKTGSAEAVDAAREAVRIAESRIAKFVAWSKAHRLHVSVSGNQHIVDALAPEGVRKIKLIRAIGFLNEELKALTAGTKWGVRVDEEMNALVNDREYFLLSDSEKFMANTVLQLAAAKFDASDMVVIDGIDILDASGRDAVVSIVKGWKGNALIALTLNVPDKMPNLATAGIGTSFWVEGGLCRLL